MFVICFFRNPYITFFSKFGNFVVHELTNLFHHFDMYLNKLCKCGENKSHP